MTQSHRVVGFFISSRKGRPTIAQQFIVGDLVYKNLASPTRDE